MSHLAEALVAFLASGSPTLTVYPMRAPDDAGRSYAVYQQISAAPISPHSGGVKLVRSRVQFTLVSDTYAAMTTMADTLRSRLGSVRTWNQSGVTLYHAWLVNETDSDEEEPGATRAMRYTRRADYMLLHSES